jgi:hypothetical protein
MRMLLNKEPLDLHARVSASNKSRLSDISEADYGGGKAGGAMTVVEVARLTSLASLVSQL